MNEYEKIILKYWLQIVLAGISGALAISYNKIKSKFKRVDAVTEGVKCLLRQNLMHSYEKYQELGYCPIYARETLEYTYKSYKALGGNGVIDDLYEDIKKLPTEQQP